MSRTTARGRRVAPVFRIGIYGPSGSGKTTYLASLSMPRTRNRSDLSATLGDVDQELGDIGLWTEDELKAFKEGRDYLQIAEDELKAGRYPPPSALKPVRYLFDVSRVKPPMKCYVEFVDYSGELLKDYKIRSEAQGRSLLNILKQSDGLIVLAQAGVRVPSLADRLEPVTGVPTGDTRPARGADPVEPGGKPGGLADQLNELQKVFTQNSPSLRERRELAPVAMFVNKWDRQSKIDPSNPDDEASKLNAYIERSGGHANLRAAIRGSIDERNFCAWPVSAFGEAKLIDGFSEVPLQANELPAFNVIEPILWLVSRCQEQRVERVELAAKGRRWYKLWQLASGEVRSRAMVAQRVCAGNKPLLQRVRVARARAGAAKLVQVLIMAPILLCLPPTGMAATDWQKWQELKEKTAENATNAEWLSHGRDWLYQYRTVSPAWNRYLRALSHVIVLSIEEAELQEGAIQTSLMQIGQRSRIDDVIRAAAKWIEEAKSIHRNSQVSIDEIDTHLRKGGELPKLPTELDPSVSKENRVKEAQELLKRVAAFESTLGEFRHYRLHHTGLALADAMLQEGRVIGAINQVSTLDEQHELVRRWRREFPRKALDPIKSRIDRFVEEGRRSSTKVNEWLPAFSYLREIRNSIAVSGIAEGNHDFYRLLDGQEARLRDERDKALYQTLRVSWSRWEPGDPVEPLLRLLTEYLEDLDMPRMVKDASAARTFLTAFEHRARGVHFRLHRLHPETPLCGRWWRDFRYELKLTVNNLPVLNTPLASGNGSHAIHTEGSGDIDLLLKPGSPIQVFATLERKTTAWIDSCGWKGEYHRQLTPRELFNRPVIRLQGQGVDTLAYIDVTLIEPKPLLREWTQ